MAVFSPRGRWFFAATHLGPGYWRHFPPAGGGFLPPPAEAERSGGWARGSDRRTIAGAGGAEPAPTIGRVPRTWILTGSPENFVATRTRDFSVIGLKERNRNRALEIESGDRIIFYLTQVKAFAGSVRVDGELYEDRTKIWPGKPGKVDAYPWRFSTAPEVVLDQPNWVSAEALAHELEHVNKWPPEHWTLAFQGQIRVVSDHDAAILLERMTAVAGAPA